MLLITQTMKIMMMSNLCPTLISRGTGGYIKLWNRRTTFNPIPAGGGSIWPPPVVFFYITQKVLV